MFLLPKIVLLLCICEYEGGEGDNISEQRADETVFFFKETCRILNAISSFIGLISL